MLVQKLLAVAELGSRAVIWLLAGLSVVSIAIALERALWFRKRRIDAPALGRRLVSLLRAGDRAGAVALLERTPGIEAEALRDALAWYDDGDAAVAEVLGAAVKERRRTAESGLLFLGTLGNNAPFVGLFGTVLGVVTAFRELGHDPTGAMNNVMSGIAEALVATAVGIVVALPAVVAFNVLQRKADELEDNVEAIGALVLAHLKSRRRAPTEEG
ncbi:MAG TPA: MotA/TolQ/ExbB proton channel family protein [Minicystis sp.]|nr:MotA/TolQ/ExbB proton channel family protein [Minicystis sp.]